MTARLPHLRSSTRITVARLVLVASALGVAAWLGSAGLGDDKEVASPRPEIHSDGSSTTDDPRHREIEEFLGLYFRSWSNQELDKYGQCFLPKASIQFIDSQGALVTYSRDPFVASQRKYHRAARHRPRETPESIDIRFEHELVRAVVYWKLTAGPKTEFGYDHFTLVEHRGDWRIVNLVFYVTKSNG